MRCSWGNAAGKAAAVSLLAVALVGCSGYTKQTAEVVNASRAGNTDQALEQLESKNTSADKDLLYYLEKGELLRQKGRFEESRGSWLSADEKVRTWEDDVKTDPSKLLGDIGSVLLNDTTRRYDGRDYEKVFLNLGIAMDHIALGDWDAARTEIKKMHERQAIIADYRSKELDAAEKASAEKGVQARSFKDLNGYPVETLDDPEVQALKNAYESAFGNYLAGFVYEALGEVSLAAPGYRNAAEMRPNTPLLDNALKDLDSHIANRGKTGKVDTLFVIETGTAPTINSVTLPILLPIPKAHGIEILATPISWPVIRPDAATFIPGGISVDDQTAPAALLTDINVMARRALKDEMPGIIARSAVRAISRGVAQAALDASTEHSSNNSVQLVGALVSLVSKVASVATEVADERIWRTLPGTYSVARLSLTPGAHKVAISTPTGILTADVNVGGLYSMVSLRVLGNSLYVAQAPVDTQLPIAVQVQAPQPMIGGTTAKPASGKAGDEGKHAKKSHHKDDKKSGDKQDADKKTDAKPADQKKSDDKAAAPQSH